MYITRDPSNLSQDNGAGRIYSVQPQFNHDVTQRVWHGYMRGDGIGVRGCYFHFEGESDRLVDSEYSDESLQLISKLPLTDLEMTFLGTKCDWCVLGSVGTRYAHFEVDENRDDENDPFVNALASVRIGRITNTNNITGVPLSGAWNGVERALNTYFQAQADLERIRSLPCGKFVVRGALEGQYSPLIGITSETSSDNETDHTHPGLVGATLNTGLRV